MQYFQSEEYEQHWTTERSQQEMFYGSQIDPGEKIRPVEQRKKPVSYLHERLLLALVSTLVFLVAVGEILINAFQPVFPNLTNVDLLLALVSYGGVNAIGNLLLSRNPVKIDRSKHITGRVIFAIASILLVPVLIMMMVMGDNGTEGVLLVLVSAVVANGISYLTLCKKRKVKTA